MNRELLDRRSWLRVFALSTTASWGGWQWITSSDQDIPSLQALAEKVLSSISPSITQACLLRVSAQLHDCQSESALELMAPILHTDDMAHQRTIDVEGMNFSHTQIGLLVLLNKGGAS